MMKKKVPSTTGKQLLSIYNFSLRWNSLLPRKRKRKEIKIAHQPVVDGFHTGTLSWLNWNLRCWFLWMEENQRIRRKTLEARWQPTITSTHRHVWYQVGIELRPHWWKSSALTAVPPAVPGKVSALRQMSAWVKHSVSLRFWRKTFVFVSNMSLRLTRIATT